jgi:signal transduction histidine kinase
MPFRPLTLKAGDAKDPKVLVGVAVVGVIAIAALGRLVATPGKVEIAWGPFGAVVLVTLLAASGVYLVARSLQADASQDAPAPTMSALLSENDALRRQVDSLFVRTAETHEAFLRRVGSELHDGPAQLIAFALLRLDSLHPENSREPTFNDFERIRTALTDSLSEIRGISAGLILPELEQVSPADVLRMAAQNHERRTATPVRCEIENLPLKLSPTLKSCLYRFTQGALNNAYQHAGGVGQTVRGIHRDSVVEITISDDGAGFDPRNRSSKETRLGLIGMRDRVTSLGGTFDLSSQPGAGTRVTARFEITESLEA